MRGENAIEKFSDFEVYETTRWQRTKHALGFLVPQSLRARIYAPRGGSVDKPVLGTRRVQ